MPRSLEARLCRLEQALRPKEQSPLAVIVMEQATPEDTERAIQEACDAKGVERATAFVILYTFHGDGPEDPEDEQGRERACRP